VGASYPDLRDRVVVVTGAGGGIGRAVAAAFGVQGARVALVGRTPEPLEAAAVHVAQAGGQAMVVPGDIALEADVRTAVAAVVERFGRLDVLVNNAAAHQPRARVVEMDLAVWERVLSVNLTGTMLFAKHAAARMIAAGGGAIVNVGSLSGHTPRLMNAAYAASKAAVAHLTRTLALELAADGVRVNAVSPGSTETPMLQQAVARDGASGVAYRIAGDPALFRSPIPLRRIGTAAEQAAAVLFLASDAASYITGQVLQVDGGEGML
jgi:NAD(P)-dependent dehydrogenase (short-subunit alcohol dehydrogenase family)